MVDEYDVVVLGTGAAGLTAAVRAAADGARVGLFERADQVGGTSAWSGGVAWLPNNRHEVEAGFVDSIEDVLTYLMSLSHGLIERPMIEAFARTAPEVVDWLEQHTPVQFETVAGLPATITPSIRVAVEKADQSSVRSSRSRSWATGRRG